MNRPSPTITATTVDTSTSSASSARGEPEIPLLDGFLSFLRTGDDDARVFAETCFADFNFPAWRLQADGLQALLDVRRRGGAAWQVHLGASRTTLDGFVAEVDYLAQESGGPTIYRTISLAVVTGDQISHLIHYCTGAWDEAAVRRHAEAGVMIRPDR